MLPLLTPPRKPPPAVASIGAHPAHLADLRLDRLHGLVHGRRGWCLRGPVTLTVELAFVDVGGQVVLLHHADRAARTRPSTSERQHRHDDGRCRIASRSSQV